MSDDANAALVPYNLDKSRDFAEAQINELSDLAAKIERVNTAMMQDSRPAQEWAQMYVDIRRIGDALGVLGKVFDNLHNKLKSETIPNAFEADGVTTFTLASGYRVTVSTALRAAIKAEKKEEAYEWLRTNGHGDLIVETVNAQTLSAAGKVMIEEGQELPEELFNSFYQNNTSMTKVARK